MDPGAEATRSKGADLVAALLDSIFARLEAPFVGQARSTAGAAYEMRTPVALAKSIVQAHGGVIMVRSDPENGTTFTVSLPA